MIIDFDFQPSALVKALTKRYCFDIEANGLLREVSLFFCAVVENVDNGDVFYYTPDEVHEFLAKLDEANWLIGHNIIGYDFPALEKLHGWQPRHEQVIRDTLIMSRMYNPNLDMHPDCPKKVWSEHAQKEKTVGPHTLMNLGYIVGCHKGDFGTEKAFDEYCEEMLEYCAQDVRVNVEVFKWLEKVMKPWTTKSIECEMMTAFHINQQMRNGWFFDISKADQLHTSLLTEMARLEDEVHQTFGPIYIPKTMVKDDDGNRVPKVTQPRVTKSGKLSSVGLKGTWGDMFDIFIETPEYDWNHGDVQYQSGSFTLIQQETFNLGSRQQIAQRLQLVGWVPTKFTEKGNIIIDDKVLNEAGEAGIKEAQLLARYFLVSKRESMVRNWLESYDWETGCIHGYVNSVGAVTSRMTHSSPNVAQTPAAKCDKETGELLWGVMGDWGADCRDLYTVPEGYVLIGADASGLELRCLAHYMGDAAYTDLILHGDIHSHNQQLAGLPTRNSAKTFIYAFLYGAGDAKIGSIVGGGSKQGKELKTRFLSGLPKLKKLLERIHSAVEGRGMRGTATLKGLDGRRVRVRSPHAALNTLLQSCGAIVCKYWLICVMQEVKKRGLDVKAVGNIHDEIQLQVRKEHAEEVKAICEAAMPAVGDYLGFRCPLAAEAKEGTSWAFTH